MVVIEGGKSYEQVSSFRVISATCPIDVNGNFHGSHRANNRPLSELGYGCPFIVKVADVWILPRMVDVSRIESICLATQTDCIRFLMEMDFPVPRTKFCSPNDFVYPDRK